MILFENTHPYKYQHNPVKLGYIYTSVIVILGLTMSKSIFRGTSAQSLASTTKQRHVHLRHSVRYNHPWHEGNKCTAQLQLKA